MLSFGIEAALAFSTAFWSERLPAGSGPPSFAATMIARVSFEKSLPRFASTAPFLCLIDDHLLCPDIGFLPHQVQEPLVDAGVVGQLRVEGGDEEPPLARQDRVAVDLGEHVDVGSRVLEPRRADEDSAQRLVPVPDVQVRFEAAHLAAESVAPRAVVAEAEVVAVENDHPGARSQDRAAELAHRVVETIKPHEAADGGRLTAGDDQPVEPVELLGEPHLDRLGTEPPQHGCVLSEVPLHGEDADPERVLHASMVVGGPRVTVLDVGVRWASRDEDAGNADSAFYRRDRGRCIAASSATLRHSYCRARPSRRYSGAVCGGGASVATI